MRAHPRFSPLFSLVKWRNGRVGPGVRDRRSSLFSVLFSSLISRNPILRAWECTYIITETSASKQYGKHEFRRFRKNGSKSTRSSQGIGPGSHLGTVLCGYTPFSPFWLHFGSILEASWADSWSIWLFFGVVL